MPYRMRSFHRYPLCPVSKKVRFDERKDAKEVLTNTRFMKRVHEQNGGYSHRQECRVYKCNDCRGWHLTSQSEWVVPA